MTLSCGLPARCAGALVGALLLALTCARAEAESRIALVIGNAAYSTSPLANPARDADLMARTLRVVGFQVSLLIDADQQTMKRAILDFGRELRTTDSVGLFYYAGHGVQVDGENFLIPVGASIRDLEEVALSSVNLTDVLKTMERSSSRLNIAILDACRDNPFASDTRTPARGLAPVTAPSGTLIAYATAPGQISLDGEGANSPYTSALSEAIPTVGSPIEDVFRRTRRKVLDVTSGKQTPWEHSSLTGEFFFKPKGAEPEATELSGSGLDPAQSLRLRELRDWEAVRASNDPAKLKAHILAYPDGLFSELATLKLAKLESPEAAWAPVVTGSLREAEAPSPLSIYERALKLESESSAERLAEAVALHRSAAERGLPSAMFAYARALDKGRGVVRDMASAISWYQRAAEAGHAGAMTALGTIYEYGEGAPLDLAKAISYYRAAAEQGDAGGLTSLAFLTAEGKGVTRDQAEARRLYTEAAERGQPRAHYNLALMQMRGEGGATDLVGAVRSLEIAASKQHAGAMRELAYLYDEGRGVARNPKRAADLVLGAVKAGDEQAKADVITRPETWSYATRREMQRRLYTKGLYTGPAHGFFDQRTRRALTKLALQS